MMVADNLAAAAGEQAAASTEIGGFQLDVDADTAARQLENLIERGNLFEPEFAVEPASGTERPDLVHSRPPDGSFSVSCPLKTKIVDDDDVIVSSQVHIEFDGVGPVVDGTPEWRRGALRSRP